MSDLAEGLARLERFVEDLPLAELPGFIGQREGPAEPDRLLTVAEAAQRLGLSKDHLYRHANAYPFVVRLGSRLRFSERGFERYIRQRQGR